MSEPKPKRLRGATEAGVQLKRAAPDLLKALKFILEHCTLSGKYGPTQDAWEMAQRAIKKAEGA